MPEVLKFFSMQALLLAVVLVLHTYMGLHIIRRGLIFCDLALGQLAALGAIIGVGLGIRYGTIGSYLLALVAVLFGSVLLAVINPRNKLIPREAVIGIIYGLALAACIMVTDKFARGGDYLAKTLTGSMLWVNWTLVFVTAAVYVALALFHFRFRRRFISLVEKPGRRGGERLWDFLFFATQGVITVLIVPIAGVLLAFGFLMIPAAIATMFATGWWRALALGWSAGFAACLVGLGSSYCFDWPYGPTLMLSLGMFFGVALVVRALFLGKNRAEAVTS